MAGSTVQAPTPGVPFTTHTRSIHGCQIFYREAGDPTASTILLLHGFPSSSHQFRHLIPLLAQHYHVLAPDYPGFGFTHVPPALHYTFTFDNIANMMAEWLRQLDIEKYSFYAFDYGAPVGLRMAYANQGAVQAIISQNGNMYIQGLGPGVAVLSDYITHPENADAEHAAREFASFAGVKGQYVEGVANPSLISPESYTLDAALQARPGNIDIQLSLFRDYGTNPGLYPKWQEYLREKQPPVLAVWGKNDSIFVPAGAEAFKDDVPHAEVHLLEGGHFLLETHVVEVGELMLDFLKRKGI
ncbi:MAG: hypothetical protein Q9159_006672 [Coniocarpon cinnabarinum]